MGKLVVIAVAVILSIGRLESEGVAPMKESDWIPQFIKGCCQVYGIDERVAVGVIRTESSGRVNVESKTGAIGLMQVLPSTARWFCSDSTLTVRDLADPFENIRIGIRYLASLKSEHKGNMRLALLSYNRGPGTVQRALKHHRNPDNGYYSRVMKLSGEVQTLEIRT